jgi:hypothetical protein
VHGAEKCPMGKYKGEDAAIEEEDWKIQDFTRLFFYKNLW